MTLEELKTIISHEIDSAGCTYSDDSISNYMLGRLDALCFIIALLDLAITNSEPGNNN